MKPRHLKLAASNGELIQEQQPDNVLPFPTRLDGSEGVDDVPLLDMAIEKLTDNEKRNGWIGWVATGAVVAAWDVSRNETMTNSYRRALAHPIGRIAAPAAAWYTIAHLHRVLPTRWDAFDGAARLMGRLRK